MPTDNTGVQTRAMAQRTDNEPQETQSQNVNPTVELYRSKDESIKDFVRKHGTIALDWYVPNFSNTRVGDLIEQRLPIETAEGRLVFSCPTLSEFFRTSNFELDLKMGQVFTYLSPPKNIGISCQKDPFHLEFLRNMLREEQDISMAQDESLERIPNIKKLAGPADMMSLEETEQKIRQFCHLSQLYTDTSVELKKKSELSQDSAVAACRVYIPYISDITRQLEEVRKIFAIEKEVRTIKNRGYFPVLHVNPQEEKIETVKDKDRILERIDEIATAMIQAARQSEENLAREQEQARARDKQLRSVRQTDRSGLNFFAQANSTSVRNDNPRTDNQGVHFKTNPTCHVYSTTSDDNDPYEPPENDSIIQTASPLQTDQPMTRMCVDYRKINKLQPEVTNADGRKGCISLIPLPKIDELYAKLKGYKVFSSLDLRSGYYHIWLTETAKPKSAIVLSSLGKYQFNRVPFGLAQAPAYFQKLIKDNLQGCNFAMGYLDDIIIYSLSEQQHLEHLEEIFIRLKAAGLKLKLKKCCFFKKHIQYLGHLISADGIQPVLEKLESIAKMPAPKNPKEVKQFLGLVGYYR